MPDLPAVRRAGQGSGSAVPHHGHPLAVVRRRPGTGRVPTAMLGDRRMRIIVDYSEMLRMRFPGVKSTAASATSCGTATTAGNCAVATVPPGEASRGRICATCSRRVRRLRRDGMKRIAILRKVLVARAKHRLIKRVSSLEAVWAQDELSRQRAKHTRASSYQAVSAPVLSRGFRVAQIAGQRELDRRLEGPRDRAATDGNENYRLPIWDASGPFVAGPGARPAPRPTSSPHDSSPRLKRGASSRTCERGSFDSWSRSARSPRTHNADNFSLRARFRQWTASGRMRTSTSGTASRPTRSPSSSR